MWISPDQHWRQNFSEALRITKILGLVFEVMQLWVLTLGLILIPRLWVMVNVVVVGFIPF